MYPIICIINSVLIFIMNNITNMFIICAVVQFTAGCAFLVYIEYFISTFSYIVLCAIK